MSTDLMAQIDLDSPDTFIALKNSVFPGAADESIKLVISYCRAAKINPLLKPVHIVPMSVKDAISKQYNFRDVVMPGINLYRIQASRSGQHIGTTEAEFGPLITENFDGMSFTYPEWALVIVKKLINGVIAEFPAKEYWKENYATAGKDTKKPNAMWIKRPFGQLAKCSEAQALRKAFPELGSAPTAEEMEGKIIEGGYEVINEGTPITKKLDDLKSRATHSKRASPSQETDSTPATEKEIDPELQQILDKIHESKNLDSLELIARKAQSLDDKSKDRARLEYAKKKKELTDEAESKAKEFFEEQ